VSIVVCTLRTNVWYDASRVLRAVLRLRFVTLMPKLRRSGVETPKMRPEEYAGLIVWNDEFDLVRSALKPRLKMLPHGRCGLRRPSLDDRAARQRDDVGSRCARAACYPEEQIVDGLLEEEELRRLAVLTERTVRQPGGWRRQAQVNPVGLGMATASPSAVPGGPTDRAGRDSMFFEAAAGGSAAAEAGPAARREGRRHSDEGAAGERGDASPGGCSSSFQNLCHSPTHSGPECFAYPSITAFRP
jgi:hypothetical protein